MPMAFVMMKKALPGNTARTLAACSDRLLGSARTGAPHARQARREAEGCQRLHGTLEALWRTTPAVQPPSGKQSGLKDQFLRPVRRRPTPPLYDLSHEHSTIHGATGAEATS
ncbi:hypothetical protein PGT21_008703 [Puccinia graminis f. sp. tritici]|uniref:Uncharacterized protein n=1 Tax=Puccinia graminis f. sp. tritici TaxID=56615 RepID=A0A5B0NU12_PUCGR|nr:hypothetical protein PGT21_008703 [Puccinia graminis f. sp. tritici]KAA1092212.1 hypothetical protein PGTUg99_021749 [Puccinia graminis f. sp. tritici]